MADFKRFRTDATGVSSVDPPPTITSLPVMLIGQASGMERAVPISNLMTLTSNYALLQYLNDPSNGAVVPSAIQCASSNAGYVLAVQANGSFAFEPAGTSGGFTPNRAIVSAATTGTLTTATIASTGAVLTQQASGPPAFSNAISVSGAVQCASVTATGAVNSATVVASGGVTGLTGTFGAGQPLGTQVLQVGADANILGTLIVGSTVTAAAFVCPGASPYSGIVTLTAGSGSTSTLSIPNMTATAGVLLTRVAVNGSTATGNLTYTVNSITGSTCVISVVSTTPGTPGTPLSGDASTVFYQVMCLNYNAV